MCEVFLSPSTVTLSTESCRLFPRRTTFTECHSLSFSFCPANRVSGPLPAEREGQSHTPLQASCLINTAQSTSQACCSHLSLTHTHTHTHTHTQTHTNTELTGHIYKLKHFQREHTDAYPPSRAYLHIQTHSFTFHTTRRPHKTYITDMLLKENRDAYICCSANSFCEAL